MQHQAANAIDSQFGRNFGGNPEPRERLRPQRLPVLSLPCGRQICAQSPATTRRYTRWVGVSRTIWPGRQKRIADPPSGPLCLALSLTYGRSVSGSGDSRYSTEIHKAAGRVSIQADCDLEQAYVLISDRAQITHVSLEAIADAVLDGSIRFGPDAN